MSDPRVCPRQGAGTSTHLGRVCILPVLGLHRISGLFGSGIRPDIRISDLFCSIRYLAGYPANKGISVIMESNIFICFHNVITKSRILTEMVLFFIFFIKNSNGTGRFG